MKLKLIILLNLLAVAPVVYLVFSPSALMAIFEVPPEGSAVPEAVRRAMLLFVPATQAILLSLSVRFCSLGIALLSLAVIVCAFLFI